MSEIRELHKRLIARQSLEELERKRWKAWTKHYYTQEDIDYCQRYGKVMSERLRWKADTALHANDRVSPENTQATKDEQKHD